MSLICGVPKKSLCSDGALFNSRPGGGHTTLQITGVLPEEPPANGYQEMCEHVVGASVLASLASEWC